MPKINVYLPDDLADAVRETGVPVSAVCQRALELSVRRVAAIRATVLGDLATDDPIGKLSQFTERAQAVLSLAVERARADGAATVGTEHLLHGMVSEGSNLALRVLQALEIEPDHVARELGRVWPSSPGGRAERFSGPAANALELTVTEALALGHNYVGCEHLLLGLLAEPDGLGGQVLRSLGAELKSARRGVAAALAGYVHLRAQGSGSTIDVTNTAGRMNTVVTVLRDELRPVIDRIARLEEHVGLPRAD